MYTGLKHLHSYTAYLVLALLISVVIISIIGWFGNKKFTKSNKKISLIALITSHFQLLFGILLYFVSPLGLSNFSGAAMKNEMSRLYILEHPLMMIIGLTLITIGYSKAKKSESDRKSFKLNTIFYGLGLLFILMMIPWNAWL